MNEDLKWLADNVHEWPQHRTYAVVWYENTSPRISWDSGTAYGGSFTRAQWQAARDELGLNQKVWRGPEDGLSPVETVCEMIHPGINNYGWQKVRIKAYFDSRVVIAGSELIWPNGFSVTNIDEELKFRSLRTEEDKAVEEMISIISDEFSGSRDDAITACRVLYRAGYRKQGSD